MSNSFIHSLYSCILVQQRSCASVLAVTAVFCLCTAALLLLLLCSVVVQLQSCTAVRLCFCALVCTARMHSYKKRLLHQQSVYKKRLQQQQSVL